PRSPCQAASNQPSRLRFPERFDQSCPDTEDRQADDLPLPLVVPDHNTLSDVVSRPLPRLAAAQVQDVCFLVVVPVHTVSLLENLHRFHRVASHVATRLPISSGGRIDTPPTDAAIS